MGEPINKEAWQWCHQHIGQGIYAYIIGDQSLEHPKLLAQITATVNEQIGPIAKPDKIQVVAALPKTRSGKIMRRILRKIAAGNTDDWGDISTLLDPSVVEKIQAHAL